MVVAQFSCCSDDDSVTKEEAIAYAMDVYDYMATTWQQELRQKLWPSDGATTTQDADFKAAVQAILDWDGQFIPEAHRDFRL